MDIEKKVLVLEPAIKSDAFLDFLNNLIRDTLNENKVLFLSIKKDGFYFIVELKNLGDLVFTMDLLGRISGISCIFIAKCLEISFDTLSQSVIQIGKEILLPFEKFSVTIRASNMENLKNNGDFLFFKKDLEFFIMSEISSLSTNTKYVTNENEADKTLFVLIGSEIAYVSILLAKNKETIPFKFFNEAVVCPIYSDYSFLSLISILNNGFFPIPYIFYNGESNLRQILKIFEKIIKRYPIKNIIINIIDLTGLHLYIDKSYADYDFNSDQRNKISMIKKLICDASIVSLLIQARAETSFVCLPFLPFLHPLWFFKKNILKSFESGKIPLTPFLFDYGLKSNLRDFYSLNNNNIPGDDSSDFYPLYLDVGLEDFEPVFQKIKTGHLNGISLKGSKQFNLDVGKDDILDILDSI